jgi:hypothetical protein
MHEAYPQDSRIRGRRQVLVRPAQRSAAALSPRVRRCPEGPSSPSRREVWVPGPSGRGWRKTPWHRNNGNADEVRDFDARAFWQGKGSASETAPRWARCQGRNGPLPRSLPDRFRLGARRNTFPGACRQREMMRYLPITDLDSIWAVSKLKGGCHHAGGVFAGRSR